MTGSWLFGGDFWYGPASPPPTIINTLACSSCSSQPLLLHLNTSPTPTPPPSTPKHPQLHILLPKAAPGWWKALLRGGAERTYHELLHEAVHADEPVTAYDELTDDSKDLIDSIRERQAYIAAGMLDPEGFDDFRVVIGENSLRG